MNVTNDRRQYRCGGPMAHVNCDSIDSATREASSRNHRVALKTRSITLSAIILAAPIAPASLPKVEIRS